MSQTQVVLTYAAHLTDFELQQDVQAFSRKHLPSVEYEALLRAARVGKDIRLYDEAARLPPGETSRNALIVTLTEEEKTALRKEKDEAFSERGMLRVIATVSLAAFLQGNFFLDPQMISADMLAKDLFSLRSTEHHYTRTNSV